jgi:phytoene synthase
VEEALREGLQRALDLCAEGGMPGIRLEGQLIRPALSYAVARAMHGDGPLSDAFWCGALAVQMAHEASLVHDDIVDSAATRRGSPTMAQTRGTGAALVHGDHLLTAAYRLAAATDSLAFAEAFARAVERTVAGEVAQMRGAGRGLGFGEYRDVALGKAGELMGCAAAVAPLLAGRADAEMVHELGRRVGLVYQMVDDLLDYCAHARTGKPALGDYRQRKWTWPLAQLGPIDWREPAVVVAERLHGRCGGLPSLAEDAMERLRREASSLTDAFRAALPGAEGVCAMVDGWVERAAFAVKREAQMREQPAEVSAALAARVPALEGCERFFARNSRSFRFASRFLAGGDWDRIARVYAFCRVTDDLADRPGPGDDVDAMLDEWLSLALRAYRGGTTGIALLDAVMGETAAAGVPFTYAAELVEGVRMDARRVRFATMAELRVYTHRVASVVGMWITELAGVRSPAVLEAAGEMGHAMQLTNILRDVGEDWRRGRIYLPADEMRRFGVEGWMLEQAAGGHVAPQYRALIEEMLCRAESSYECAMPSIRHVPAQFRRAFAVAAHVYRGIHAPLRRAGCDNFTRRAVTSTPAKVVLAGRALWQLQRQAWAPASHPGITSAAGQP